MKALFEKYFRFYFVICLMSFVLMVLLMNLPRVLASDTVGSSNVYRYIKRRPYHPPFPQEDVKPRPELKQATC